VHRIEIEAGLWTGAASFSINAPFLATYYAASNLIAGIKRDGSLRRRSLSIEIVRLLLIDIYPC
jgi:hypothetical protein